MRADRCSKEKGSDVACLLLCETVGDGTSFLAIFLLAAVSAPSYAGGILIGGGFQELVAGSSGLFSTYPPKGAEPGFQSCGTD
jgi:hypothetical protein